MSENPAASEPLNEPEFSSLVEGTRAALRGYILSISLDRDMADEVFQETLIQLWRDRMKFERGSNFRGWAFRYGYFAALAKKRDRFREKTVCYPDEFFHRIAEHAERHTEHAEARLGALRACVASLNPDDRALVQQRYGAEKPPVESEPPATNRTHKALSRLRLRLKICIEKRLKSAE